VNELALFAGCGGGILASHLLGWNTVCAVEIEDYRRRVLLARQRDGLLHKFPIWDDVCTFDGRPWRERESMSSQEGSPVRTSVSRVKVSELPESVQVYGSRCCALLGRLGLALSSRKTVRTCVPVGLAPLSRDLPAWGMTVGGECWEVGTSASHKDVTVYGYSQVVDGSLYDSLPSAFHASAAKNLTVPCTVSTIPSVPVLGLTTLKTVDGKSEMKVLVLSPTPLKDDWKGGTITKHSTSGRPRMDQFRHLVKIIFGWTYPIPTHTERLMGFPIGWSDLKPLEMRRFQQWQQQHSAFFPQDLSN
jgi:hypothetical protein